MSYAEEEQGGTSGYDASQGYQSTEGYESSQGYEAGEGYEPSAGETGGYETTGYEAGQGYEPSAGETTGYETTGYENSSYETSGYGEGDGSGYGTGGYEGGYGAGDYQANYDTGGTEGGGYGSDAGSDASGTVQGRFTLYGQPYVEFDGDNSYLWLNILNLSTGENGRLTVMVMPKENEGKEDRFEQDFSAPRGGTITINFAVEPALYKVHAVVFPVNPDGSHGELDFQESTVDAKKRQ